MLAASYSAPAPTAPTPRGLKLPGSSVADEGNPLIPHRLPRHRGD